MSWRDVLACFADRADPAGVIERLSREWAQRFGVPYRPLGPRCTVRAERWTHLQVGEHLDRLAQIEPRLVTCDPPRRLTGSLVLVDFGEGRIGQIDGRRRANVWRNAPGEYEVLIVCAVNAPDKIGGDGSVTSTSAPNHQRTLEFDVANPSLSCKIDGCAKPAKCRSMCRAHYARWLRYGDPLAGDAFQGEGLRWIEEHAKYAGDDCIRWPFGKKNRRYGAVKFDGAMRCASRVMCIIAHGPPDDPAMQAAHSCGNGHLLCMNHSHLSWKTAKGNYRDAVEHGTWTRGEKVASSKLTEDQAREIKQNRSRMTQAQLASRFCVDRSCVSLIQRGRNWAWVR